MPGGLSLAFVGRTRDSVFQGEQELDGRLLGIIWPHFSAEPPGGVTRIAERYGPVMQHAAMKKLTNHDPLRSMTRKTPSAVSAPARNEKITAVNKN
jgi:hypothetical protein